MRAAAPRCSGPYWRPPISCSAAIPWTVIVLQRSRASCLFATLLEAEEDLSEEQGWLQWLLSCVIPLDGPGPRNTVAAWLRQSVKSTSLYDRQEADRILGQYGLKAIRPKSKEGEEPTHFAVADHGS